MVSNRKAGGREGGKAGRESRKADTLKGAKAGRVEAGNALSHVDARGRVQMVDVGDKAVTRREAVARGSIAMSREALRLIRAGAVKKGDPLQTARLAGILAAKQTSALIPLCHPLPLSNVEVELTPTPRGYDIEARVRTTGQTGVEMEALTAVAIAALTVYDMVKAVDKSMVIGEIRLMHKSGGRSGVYTRREGQEEQERQEGSKAARREGGTATGRKG
jgi:cyclic pyranopterin phosphate synthase